jgi:hypothetical protein
MGGSEGNAECYITKLAKDGQSIIFSTFFGGTDSDWCYAMGIDANDRIAITGTTYSTDFPLTNPHQSTHSSDLDAFVAVIESDGQSVVYSTFLGGAGVDHGRGVDFDSEGNLYVTGQIGSDGLGTENAFQNDFAGGAIDAYLAKYNEVGLMECFSYLGGSSLDRGNDLKVDSNDKIIITGYTLSPDFPIHKAYQEEQKSCDVFVTKFDKSCQKVDFSTFIGGSDLDNGNALSIDQEDNIFVTGHITSEDFPTTNTIYPLLATVKYNVHLTKLSKDGSKLLFSFAFGGEQEDVTVGVAVDDNQGCVIIGFTQSEEYPIYRAIQGKYAGNCDLFIMKLQIEDAVANRRPLIIGLSVGIGGSSILIISIVLIVLPRKLKRS